MIFCDIDLARRIERAEARANAAFVEARAEVSPDSGACWIEAGGAFAMFDGAESPLTQTFGLGVFETATDEILDRLEAFFKERGAPVFHEVCPVNDLSLLALLNKRGYEPVELSNVLFLPLAQPFMTGLQTNPLIETRVINAGEENLWAETSGRAWTSESEELADFMYRFGQISARSKGGFPFIAEEEGKPISTGMLFIFDDTALLAGASTIPESRKRGGQTALLDSRLRFAAERGCKIAVMVALPGSQSQRNAEKNGFRVAYTRTKWKMENG